MAERKGHEASAEASEPGPAGAAGLRFVLAFVCFCAVFFCLYYFPYAESGVSEGWVTVYLERYAAVVGSIVGLFEPGVVVSHNMISGRFAMSIVKSCDAMEANILFCAAVLALPGAWLRKAAALAAGLAALVGVNVVRLCCLYYVGVYFGSWFEFAHLDLWPFLMIAFAVLDFMVCARWIAAPTLHGSPAGTVARAVG
jgi:exosortase/archaeosortase family protein